MCNEISKCNVSNHSFTEPIPIPREKQTNLVNLTYFETKHGFEYLEITKWMFIYNDDCLFS